MYPFQFGASMRDSLDQGYTQLLFDFLGYTQLLFDFLGYTQLLFDFLVSPSFVSKRS